MNFNFYSVENGYYKSNYDYYFVVSEEFMGKVAGLMNLIEYEDEPQEVLRYISELREHLTHVWKLEKALFKPKNIVEK